MPQRRPDETREEKVFGHPALIEIWVDDTDLEWDGDEPLPPNSEGYDICTRAHLTVDGESWTSYDSLSGVWIDPMRKGDRKYLDDMTNQCVGAAINHLQDEIRKTAKGADVARAIKREKIALQLGEQDR